MIAAVIENGERKGQKTKYFKKCQKGEVSTFEMYRKCLNLGVNGKPSLEVKLDISRIQAKHDLNASDIRDLLLSIASSRNAPRYFAIKNKFFVRNILIVHISESMPMLVTGLGKSYYIKVSRSNNVMSLPQALLSISEADLNPPKRTANKVPPFNEESRDSGDCRVQAEGDESESTREAKCILSEPAMRTYGFPMLFENLNRDEEVGDIDTSMKALRRADNQRGLEDCPFVGVRCGAEYISPQHVTEQIIGSKKYPHISVEFEGIVAEGFLQTQFSPTDSFDDPVSVEGHGLCASLTQDRDDSRPRRKMVALDCEMCDTKHGLEVTRLTLVNENNDILLDTLVKPSDKIIDYRTPWSGMTAEVMHNVNVTFAQARLAFLRIVTADTILVGHSLENDLQKLKICHLRCADTSVIFPHPMGYPLRQKLRNLASVFLHRKIQSNMGGHDSVEDARAAMDLVKLKLEKGADFGVKSGRNECGNFDSNGMKTRRRVPLLASLSANEVPRSLFVCTTEEQRGRMLSCIFPPTESIHVDQGKRKFADLEVRLDDDKKTVASKTPYFPSRKDFMFKHDVKRAVECVSTFFTQAESVSEASVCSQSNCQGVRLACLSISAPLLASYARQEKVAPELSHGQEVTTIATAVHEELPSSSSSSSTSIGYEAISAIATSYSANAAAVHNVELSMLVSELRDVLRSSAESRSGGGGSLLIVSTQSSMSELEALQKRKKACLNVKASLSWSDTQEAQLKMAYETCNMASVVFCVE